MKRNISLNYSFSFFQYFGITALWVLFLSQRGFSATEIGLLESLFHLTSFCFEIPSGTLGDRFGYKNTLLFGRGISILSALLILSSHNFYVVGLGFIFNALSYNFSSGTNEAFLYESLKKMKKERKYLKVSANLNMIIETSNSLGLVLAGILSETFFDGTYYLQILVSGVALGIGFFFKEPVDQVVAKKKTRYFTLMKEAFGNLLKIPGLLFMMLSFAFLDSLNAIYYFYFQNYFGVLGIKGIGISVVMLISLGIQLGASHLAKKIGAKISQSRLFYLLGSLLTGSILATVVFPMPIPLFSFVLVNGLASLLFPIKSTWINDLVPSSQRATLNSVDSLCFSLMMIPLFPVLGFLMEKTSYAVMFTALGLLVGSGTLFIGRYFKKEFI